MSQDREPDPSREQRTMKKATIYVHQPLYNHLQVTAKSLGMSISTLARLILIEGAVAIKLGSFVIDPDEEARISEVFPDTGPVMRIDVYLPLGVWFFLDTVASAYGMSFSQLGKIIIRKRLFYIKTQGIKIEPELIQRALALFRDDEEAAIRYLEMVEKDRGRGHHG